MTKTQPTACEAAMLASGTDTDHLQLYVAATKYLRAKGADDLRWYDTLSKPLRRAQRYMEKRLLRNLWRAWRQASRRMQPILCMPAANNSDATKPSSSAKKTNTALGRRLVAGLKDALAHARGEQALPSYTVTVPDSVDVAKRTMRD